MLLLCKIEYKSGWNTADEFLNRINSEMMLPTEIRSNVFNILEIGFQRGENKMYFQNNSSFLPCYFIRLVALKTLQ